MSAPDKAATATTEESSKTIDGFHLVIDALKLNDIDTIFGLLGIPITDLARLAQAEGMRFIAFRHEQHAGNAAAVAGYLTQKPGICLTVSAPGFLNGLTALANATTNCFPMILISGSSEREIVDLQQGDYEEMDQLAIAKPLCKAAYRVLHAEDIGIGIARAIRAARVRPPRRRLPGPAGQAVRQTLDAQAGKKSLVKVVDPVPRQIPAPDAVQARARPAQGRQASADPAGQGRGLRPGRRRDPRAGRKDRHPLPADVHGQGPAARHPRAIGLGLPLLRAGGGRRRDADRRAPELAALARQGQDLGRPPKKPRTQFIQIDIAPTEIDSNVAIAAPRDRRHRLLRVGAAGGHRLRLCQAAADWTGRDRRAQGQEHGEDGGDAGQESVADELPQRAARDPRRAEDASGHQPRQRRRQRPRFHPQHRRHVPAAQALRRRAPGASWASAWAIPSARRS